MTDPTILLVDNGSSRPDSTLNLRRLAALTGEAAGRPVYPVSLQHADKVDAARLDGRPADVMTDFLRRRLEQGERDFLVLPLFFGPSRALSAYIPEQAALLAETHGPFRVQQAAVLWPEPEGEPRLARILCDNVRQAGQQASTPIADVLLVDHGSPLPAVTRVRHGLAQQMRACLGDQVDIGEAVMERRPGPEYDFNGPLLEQVLRERAAASPDGEVILSLLFLNPGRHAGAGGDIESICDRVQAESPHFRAIPSPLVGSHDGLVDILVDRLQTALGQSTPSQPVSGVA